MDTSSEWRIYRSPERGGCGYAISGKNGTGEITYIAAKLTLPQVTSLARAAAREPRVSMTATPARDAIIALLGHAGGAEGSDLVKMLGSPQPGQDGRLPELIESVSGLMQRMEGAACEGAACRIQYEEGTSRQQWLEDLTAELKLLK